MGNETTQTASPVPFAVYESAIAHAERNAKRFFVGLILAVTLLFVSNCIWLYAWTQYDYVSDTYTQDGSGVNLISGRDAVYGPTVQETD